MYIVAICASMMVTVANARDRRSVCGLNCPDRLLCVRLATPLYPLWPMSVC